MSLGSSISTRMLPWSCCVSRLERRFNTRFASLDARTNHRAARDELDCAACAARFAWSRCAGAWPRVARSVSPGEEQGTFKWPGAGQIYSSSRDMATFLAANMGELADHGAMENAMAFAQQPVFTVSPRLKLGLAWQNVSSGNLLILDKNGGLNNTSTHIGFARSGKLGVVILVNSRQTTRHRDRPANPARAGAREIRAIEPKANRNRIPTDVSLRSRKDGLATQLGTSTDMPHCVSYRFPLRTASTTSRIASITSCGCSLCISWPLFVLVMCFSLGTSLASRSCAFFCAASVT